MKTMFTIMTPKKFSRNLYPTRLSASAASATGDPAVALTGVEGRECCMGAVTSSPHAHAPKIGPHVNHGHHVPYLPQVERRLALVAAFALLLIAPLAGANEAERKNSSPAQNVTLSQLVPAPPPGNTPPAQPSDTSAGVLPSAESAGTVATPPEEAPVRASELKEVDQRLRIVERRVEITEEKKEEDVKKVPSVTASGKGFLFNSPDKTFQVRIRGLLQADSRSYFQDAPAPDTLLLRRVRPYVDATLFGSIDVRIMPDFAEGKAVLFDAYADLHPFKSDVLRLRIGKFKTPVGLERLQSASNITFVERSYVTSLVPNRDVGISLYGDVGRGALQWAVGLFNGVVDGGNGDVDGTDSKEIAGRLFFHPLAFFDSSTETGENVGSLTSYRKAVGIGVGASYGRPRGAIATSGVTSNLPSFKSPGQQTAFSYLADTPTTAGGTVLANGSHYRISPQFYTYLGSLGVLGELVYAPQAVIKGAQTATLENTAWQIAASYVLTGEDASYDGIKPLAPVSLSDGHWGAWELGFRYHELRLDGGAFPIFADTARSIRKAQSFGGVLNWYLTNQLRFALDFEYSTFEWGARQGRDRQDEKVLFSRLQVNF